MGCNYLNRDTTDARTSWSLCPVQDIGSVLTNRYNANENVEDDDTLSLLYYDLYLRQLKETLKHTMLVHESVFESQIHDLHRLYRRQKELMMEMEETRHHEALDLNSTFPSHGTHWMSSCISTYPTMNFPYGENIRNQTEAVDNVKKFEKNVLDLELPASGCHDREEERSLMCCEADEVVNSLKEQSSESGNQSSKLLLDLNEPAKIEEHSDHVFNQFLSPVISSEIGEESDKKNDKEDSVKGSNSVNEAQGKTEGGCGIDLNMSPFLSEEEVNVVKKFETEKPQECLSASLSVNNIAEHSRVVVQALPCLNSILLLNKPYKSMMRSSRPRKKVKLDPVNKTFKDSDLDQHSTAQATSESQSDQVTTRKSSSSSLSKVKSAKNQTNLGKRRRCKPQMKSNTGHEVVAKRKRKRSRKISLVTDRSYQEISAAEAIVDMSRKSGGETSDCIDSVCSNLLWLAEIASSVGEDCELDYFEAKTLQLTEMKLDDHKTVLRSNYPDNKTAVSSIVHGKQRRSWARQRKLQQKDDRRGDNLSLQTFSECDADEVIGKLSEASESKWDCRFPKHKSKSSPAKPIDAFTSSVEERTGFDWGATKKRRRGSRIPAADFKHMVSSTK